MKGNWKVFLSGMVASFLIIGFALPAFAAYQKTATLNYNDIKITVDGTQVTPKDANGNTVEPFIIDGTTYLPVRGIASALALDVSWDQATQTAKLTSNSSGQSSGTNTNPPVASSEYSRTNPAPVGTSQTFTVKESWGEYNVTMKITDAFRGQTAWAAIRDANRFNAEPTSSREYILVAVEATVNSISTDRAVTFNDYDFTPFSGSNAEYETVSTVNPDPEFGGQAYAGATIKGFVSFVVDTSDLSPKAVYGSNYDGTDGAWFSLVSSK